MIIPVVNRKGGVGKTTTVVNLAAALAQAHELGIATRDFRTLVVDLDPQGNAAASLSAEAGEESPDLSDVLLRGIHIEDALRRTSTPNLHLVAGSEAVADDSAVLRAADAPDLSSSDRAAFLRRFRSRLRDALAMLQSPFDFILCDCPAGMGLPIELAMIAGDQFLVPTTLEHFAGIQVLLDRLIRLRTESAYRMASILGIVITDANYQIAETACREADMRSIYGRAVMDTAIRRNVTIERAQGSRRTIFQHDPRLRSSGAHGHRDLAAEILLRCVGRTVMEDELSADVHARGARLGFLPATL